MASTIRVYHAQLEVETRRIGMDVGRRILDDLEREARFLAATGPYTTGKLAASLYNTGPIPSGRRVTGSVGSTLSYAKSVESGARQHDIFPRRAAHVYRFGKPTRPTLKFYWLKGGRTVYANQIPMAPGTIDVSHPGQKGKGFLRAPLFGVALRYGLRVVIYDV